VEAPEHLPLPQVGIKVNDLTVATIDSRPFSGAIHGTVLALDGDNTSLDTRSGFRHHPITPDGRLWPPGTSFFQHALTSESQFLILREAR
jgi:hypothetical protein